MADRLTYTNPRSHHHSWSENLQTWRQGRLSQGEGAYRDIQQGRATSCDGAFWIFMQVCNRKSPIEPQSPHPGNAGIKTRNWTLPLTHQTQLLRLSDNAIPTAQTSRLRQSRQCWHDVGMRCSRKAYQSGPTTLYNSGAQLSQGCLRSSDWHLGDSRSSTLSSMGSATCLLATSVTWVRHSLFLACFSTVGCSLTGFWIGRLNLSVAATRRCARRCWLASSKC